MDEFVIVLIIGAFVIAGVFALFILGVNDQCQRQQREFRYYRREARRYKAERCAKSTG